MTSLAEGQEYQESLRNPDGVYVDWDCPQGLKPTSFFGFFGTAKAMP
jgi:hypothetical protein